MEDQRRLGILDEFFFSQLEQSLEERRQRWPRDYDIQHTEDECC